MDVFPRALVLIMARHLLVMLAYALVAKLVLLVFSTNEAASIIWPSSGIALAALLLGGKKYLVSVALGVFLGALWTGNTLPVAAAMTVGGTLEAAIAAACLSRLRIDINLGNPRDYGWLVVVAALASLVSAVCGAMAYWFSGSVAVANLSGFAMIWWQGDVLGMILVTPLLLIWRKWPTDWLKKDRILETVAFFALAFVVGQIIFLGWFADIFGEYVRFYWVFLFVAWASVRFGRHGVILLVMLISMQCLSGVLSNLDLFDTQNVRVQLQNFWFFTLVLAGIGLTLALVIYQRQRDQDFLLRMKENAERALYKLDESERRHRLLFEYAKDALMTMEPPFTTFTAGNREALSMFGVPDEADFQRYGILDFSTEHQPGGEKSLDRFANLIDQAIRHGSCFFEWTYRRKSGQEFPANVLLTAISIGGKLVVQAAVRDITIQKQTEQALREMNETLELRVKERTAELHKATQIAEMAAHEKSEFLANMSHEIRIPISSVLGMAYLALKTRLDERQRDYIEKIQLSAQHLLGLIDSILDFSKLEAGHVVLEHIDFNLGQVIDTLQTLVQEKAVHKGLRLRIEMDTDVRQQLRGDPLRLAQILINYVNNAIKFTEHGDIVVHISNVERSGHDALMRFAVSDCGIGIPLSQQATIFDSFKQVDASVSRKYGGTGLGLAISKQLAEMMGGEVGLHSMPGEGSTFWFTARLGKGSDADKLAGEAAGQVPDDTETYRKLMQGVRILLAEDNEINQQVARELLELVGVSVSVANNGREVIELLREEQFSCVLMDVQMPEMDGLQATRAIRADQALSHNIVIAMTANAWSVDQQRCMEAGMDDFISKPVMPAHLYATVVRWLDKAHDQTIACVVSPQAAVTPSAVDGQVQLQGDPAVIDLSILAQSLGNNACELREFVSGRYLPSTRRGIDEMQAALQAGDLALLRSLGHKYKSSARTVGALGFADLCQALESLPETDYLPGAKALIARMQVLLEQITEAIKPV